MEATRNQKCVLTNKKSVVKNITVDDQSLIQVLTRGFGSIFPDFAITENSKNKLKVKLRV